MPRWAEILGIVGVALVVAFAILVIARLRTRGATQALDEPDPTLARARAIPSLPAGLLDVAAPPPLATRAVDEAAAEGIAAGSGAIGAAEPPPVVVATADTRDAGSPVALADASLPDVAAPELAEPAVDVLEDVVAPTDILPAEDADDDTRDAPDGLDALDGAAPRAEATLEAAAPATVAPGSRDELALLQEAEQTLAHLHSVRLRGDIPRQVVLDDAKRLEAILAKLPDDRRAALNALLDAGYRRLGTVELGPDGVPTVRGTTAPGVDGKDDRPVDLIGLTNRRQALERQLGLTPAAPVATRPAATNPRALPSVESAPLSPPPAPSAAPIAPSTLPSAQPSPL